MSRPAAPVSGASSSALSDAGASTTAPPSASDATDTGARVEAFKKKAAKAFRDRRFTAAAMHLSDAISIDPSNHTLYSNRSAAFAALENYPRALTDANKCISLAPSFAKGYFRAGHALESLQRHAEALTRFEQGSAIDPTSPELQIATACLRSLMAELADSAAAAAAAAGGGESKSSSTASPPGAVAAGGSGPSPAAAEADSFARMVSWLEAGGATFPNLYLKNYKDGFRGVHASAHILPESLVLFVPRRFIMTSEVARASSIGRAITDSRVELRSKHSYIAAYLLQERDKGADSFWAPYIAILPKQFDSVPLFFNDEELSWLEGSFTVGKVADRIESLQAEYEALRDSVPSFSRWSFDDFAWARVCVITRIFGFTLEGIKTDGLVPYADMLNHKLPRETRWQFDRACDGFTITSLTPIEKGAQVFDSYGQKSNTRFFINYGFTVEDNPEFEAVLRLEIPDDDPLLRHKRVLLSRGGAVVDRRREYQVPCDYSDNKTRNIFSFARIAVANESELQAAYAASSISAIPALSARNEAAALSLLANAARTALARFPTSLAADHHLLESGALEPFSNKWNCVVLRRGEKVVLSWFDALQRCYGHVISPPSSSSSSSSAAAAAAAGDTSGAGAAAASVAGGARSMSEESDDAGDYSASTTAAAASAAAAAAAAAAEAKATEEAALRMERVSASIIVASPTAAARPAAAAPAAPTSAAAAGASSMGTEAGAGAGAGATASTGEGPAGAAVACAIAAVVASSAAAAAAVGDADGAAAGGGGGGGCVSAWTAEYVRKVAAELRAAAKALSAAAISQTGSESEAGAGAGAGARTGEGEAEAVVASLFYQ